MRGKIVSRTPGSYTIILDVGKDAGGKRRQQWVTIRGTKRDAEKRLSEMLHQLDTGSFMRPGKTTVAEFLSRWLEDHKAGLSPRGYERYRDIVTKRLVPALGGLTLTQLRPEHLQKLYTTMQNAGLSARTVRYHHSVINGALKTALEWGLIVRNPAEAVKRPKIERPDMQTWDEDEVSRFLEVARSSPYYALFYTALFTGMRRSELLGLKWGDVDLTLGQASVGRGLHHLKDGRYVFTEPKSQKSRRTIALTPSNSTLLRQYKDKRSLDYMLMNRPLGNEELVFSNGEGKPWRPNTITRAWETAAAHAGLKVIRLHDARHTHASIMLKQGIHPKIVQERLGHASIEMTLDTYSHVTPGLQEAAAARFDNLIKPKAAAEAR